MADWQVQSARITVFVTPDTTVPATLWRDLLGDEPENSATQRAMSMRTYTGPFADGALTLQVLPMRIDWIYEPAGLALDGGFPPALGRFPAAVDPLIHLGRRWVVGTWFPPTPRIALGLVLASPTHDRETGYRELTEFIDGVPDAANASDFQYQVNRRRPSTSDVKGLELNRLSKWSVGAFRQFSVLPGAAAPSPMVGPIFAYLRLELDINTAADFDGLIPHDHVDRVVDDLLSGADEISRLGNRL